MCRLVLNGWPRRDVSQRRSQSLRDGFTLVEALVAVSIMSLAGAALILASQTAADSSADSHDRLIAYGLAQQLMDEVVGARYCEPGEKPDAWPLGPSTFDSGGLARERYNDIDDYDGLATQGAVDPWGVAIGDDDGHGGERHPSFRLRPDYLRDWQQQVRVYYADEGDLSQSLPDGQTGSVRVIEVRILATGSDGILRNLATLRRVCSYVPPAM
jgi:prepilin-type N-terminal cleavage/methylation domain-containing protein